ncbi:MULTISPECIES: winged helix-turn-helix transcriptional regulator [Bacillaceae]|uniref:DNA-binding HxlR family transcriptional regulator n=1 Tax=Peribacillus huizhouensis TaxID=1501239 RepID=A0ABR6CMJ9_9BACI|nr:MULTISPECIES: helix-turn-helix domain-containing protein [Bacillaceae]MBA9026154.1 DNA-binding HxlR family transcriptional regulator [Peribacillus huizhouensis]
MNRNAKEREPIIESSCHTYRLAIEFIGKRWTGIIIYQLFEGPKRYHELLNAIDGISDRLLSERLKDLELEGLLRKHVIAEAPKKVEYELTPPGYEFIEVFKAIMNWAGKKEEYLKGGK